MQQKIDLNEEELEQERKNVVDFQPRIIAGGKGTDDGPWILQRNVGDVFAVRTKSNRDNFLCPQFELLSKTNKTAELEEHVEGKYVGRVDAVRFCNAYDFVELIAETVKEENDE